MASLTLMVSNTQDPLASIGLKTVCALAKDFNYYRVYGMNTTMIRLEQPD